MKAVIKKIKSTPRTHAPLVAAGAALVIAIIIVTFVAIKSGESSRGESYKKVSGGAAGLQAVIDYDCTGDPCGKNAKFNFNVYIFKEDGQQISVIQPNDEGKLNIALPGGNYILLIGKRFGHVFPQEPITLKNGQELELKLHY